MYPKVNYHRGNIYDEVAHPYNGRKLYSSLEELAKANPQCGKIYELHEVNIAQEILDMQHQLGVYRDNF